jgi:hypothetical protein
MDKPLINANVYETNPKSFLTKGKRLSLEARFPGYVRNPEGGVECRNMPELRCSDGIILEVMKRAGQQLLEGKQLIGVSLPVRIFEPRSTIVRLTDLWGSGPLYLNKAAKCRDPIERMKMIIAFSISGIHTNIKQLKPFNPILGETYEGYWPDGSRIYAEHMSHHPPITRFYLLGDGWKYYGYYEYVVKLKGFTGNVVGGNFRGPNIIEFSPEDKVSFIMPNMNITGLTYGRRLVDWDGTMEYNDPKNNIQGHLTFTPPPKFYQSFKEPTDFFRGEIKQDGITVHKLYGSPLNHLTFDDDL